MEEIKKPIVIAIASISGVGKTTIVGKLNEELLNSKALTLMSIILKVLKA